MLKHLPKKSFGLFQSFKKIWTVPMSHINHASISGSGDNQMLENQTILFDDVAQEWQASFVENTYELNTFQSMDAISQGNFGTLDNPHLIFTSDVPFRFVGCTGPPNEDDYEGHELFFFLLREGPLQRCQSCGQVFKLVRLRDEYSTENDYYQSQFFRQDWAEYGDSDHLAQQSYIRLMPHSWEHTHFENASNKAFTLVNPDDHDRILTDPAYRLERIKVAESVTDSYLKTMREIDRSIQEKYGYPQTSYSKDSYENVVKAEMALKHLERHFKNVQRFNIRSVLDSKNHERREKRMLERAEERLNKSHTVYLGTMTEKELQFRDYFESDEELINNLNQNVAQDKADVLSSPYMKMDRYRFMEISAENAELDSDSYARRKLFRFNYRQTLNKLEDHQRKEERMLKRFSESNFHQELNQLDKEFKNAGAISTNQSNKYIDLYYELLINQAVSNYKNYFESDLEEDFEFFEKLGYQEKRDFLTTYSENGLKLNGDSYAVSHIMIPKENDPEDGIFSNFKQIIDEVQFKILPVNNLLNEQNLNQNALDFAMKKLEINESSNALNKK